MFTLPKPGSFRRRSGLCRFMRALRRRIEQRKNAAIRLTVIFGFGAARANFRKTGKPILRIAHPAFRPVSVVQPSARSIAHVAAPSAAMSTICAFRRMRCSVFVERAKASSSARSKSVKVIAVASGMLRIQP